MKTRSYTPDFFISGCAGRSLNFLIECKGRFDPDDRKTLLGVRESHPTLDLRIMFQRDNFISKKSRTRYSDWATKQGFLWALGTEVPEEWLL